MVEAKCDEPFGPKLCDWRAEASPGKLERLGCLLATLGLDPETLDGTLRYQLLHRTASAILTAQRYGLERAAMVVQSFSPGRSSFEDFSQFVALFNGIEAAPDQLYDVGKQPSGISLHLGWASAPFRST